MFAVAQVTAEEYAVCAAGSLSARIVESGAPITRRVSDEEDEVQEEWRLLDALHSALSEALWEQVRARRGLAV